MKKHFCNFILVVFLFHLIFNSSQIASQEVENEREFDYAVGSGMGPEKWGKMHKEWEACNNGEMQSPIDMLNKRVRVIGKLDKLKRKYRPANATLKNRGHDIMLRWDGDAGSLKVNGTAYKLKQCHWHSPSEHTVNGKRFDLEMHLVHEIASKNSFASPIAVVGVMYNIGRPDSFLRKLEKHITHISDSQEELKLGVINPRHIKMGGRKYYRYMGSLTVPPCTEGVFWIMNKRVRTTSRRQMQLLRTAVHDYAEANARPLQPLHGRAIHLVDPSIRTSN